MVMNGVPNGPINRYDPVIDSVLNNNIVVDSDHIQLCAGSDAERSAAPIRTTMDNNVFMSRRNKDMFTVYDDISGIDFSNNIIAEQITPPAATGFNAQPYYLTRNAQGLLSPSKQAIDVAGFKSLQLPVTKEQVGASFYQKSAAKVAFGSGRTTSVPPGMNTLVQAINESKPGDVLNLINGAEYLMTKLAVITHPLTITSNQGEKPILHSEKSNFFVIDNGGSLELDNLWLDGKYAPDSPGNSAIRTSRYSMNRNYSLVVRNCRVTNLDVNHSFQFLRVSMSTFADLIQISNTTMENISGSILSLNKETDDLGIYNVENLILRDNQFTDIQGAIIDIYRGGTDESTFGPIVTVENNRFARVGLGKRNKPEASMAFHGVQKLIVADSLWEDSAPVTLHLTNGEPITRFDNIVLKNSGKIRSNSDQYTATNIIYE